MAYRNRVRRTVDGRRLAQVVDVQWHVGYH
jgi:hypothetical protein